MLKIKLFLTFVIFAVGYSLPALAGSIDDKKLIQKFVPSRLLKDENGEIQSLGKGISASAEWAEFDKKGKSKFLVIAYSSYINGVFKCELMVVKSAGKESSLMDPPVLEMADEVEGCSEIELRDLDNDKIPEVVVKRIAGGMARQDGPPAFFKWDGKKLVSITPTKVLNDEKFNALHSTLIADKSINGDILIIDTLPDNPEAPRRFYIMKDGKIILKESHAFVTFLGKHEKVPVDFAPKLPEEGEYYLEVTNLSEHKRAVRAEVFINGSKVLKPEDFCADPAPKNLKRSDRDDDAEDGNEDQCRRCNPKGQVYAIVNMKKVNEMKVRVFGKKDSKVKITLNKK